MAQKFRTKKSDKSLAYGVVWGIAVCLTAWVLLSAASAYLIIGEHIQEMSVQWLIPIMQFLTSFGGAYVAGRVVGEKKMVASVATALVYLVALISASLLVFDSELNSFALNLLAISAGAATSIILNYYIINRPARRKRLKYHK